MTLTQEIFEEHCKFLLSKTVKEQFALDINELVAVYNVASNLTIADSIQKLVNQLPLYKE